MTEASATTRIACAQIAPAIGDLARNRELAHDAIHRGLASQAKVIVLPELATTGYYLERDQAEALAEPADGPSIASWVAALRGSDAIVIGGFCERSPDGAVYNSAALVTADGVVSVYRKAHLWAGEPQLFERGSAPPPVVETRWGRIGYGVCYDLFFPEVVRDLALAGAQLLVFPTNSPAQGLRPHAAPANPDGIGHVVARAAAYLNRVFVAVCDRHGDEAGDSWNARSSIIDPEGRFLAGPVEYAEALLLADCELSDAYRKVWDGTANDAFADRRPELYGHGARRHAY